MNSARNKKTYKKLALALSLFLLILWGVLGTGASLAWFVDVSDEDTAKDDEEAPREVSLSEYKEDDSIPSYRLRSDNYSKDERPQYNTFSVKESFTQSLMEQLGYRNLTEHQYAVAAFLVGSLDDDGYLRRSLDSVVDDLSFVF